MTPDFSFASNWSWDDFCGRDTFVVWNSKHHDLDICFQYVAFQMPILTMLAIVSAYHVGSLKLHIRRCERDLRILRMRSICTLALSAIPFIRSYLEETRYPGQVHSVEYTITAIQSFTWLVHFTYIAVLQNRLSSSLRGPIPMGVLWSIYYASCWMNLHSNFLIVQRPDTVLYESGLPFYFAIIETVVQTLYLLTLLPSGQVLPRIEFQPLSSPSQPSIMNPFGMSAMREDYEPGYLGAPMDGYSFLGRLLFCWVNPLLDKGAQGDLKTSNDLFELPTNLTSEHLVDKMKKAVYPLHEQYIRRSLVRALHSCFWVEFYGIGVLKFIGDIAGFCSPLLLKELIQFIETRSDPISYGYTCAAGLCLTSLIGAFCNAHFNFKMSMVSLKIRGAMVSLIYSKMLSLNSATISSLKSGEIINYMSTDVNRIMNSCISFHSFWSIPLEVAVICYLLYLQVGIAFLAVIILTFLLIPVNKYTASLIGRFSTAMMAHKDDRISCMGQILKGMKTIKFNVWESAFVKMISGHRRCEMKYLSYRKYLDAVCVYLWATTPVMVTTSTIFLYLRFGHELTATLVFTTITLLNMLITPLNSFPWVLNGLVDAWVSIKRVEKLMTLSDENLRDYYEIQPKSEPHDIIEIENADFHWGDTSFHLQGINFSARDGQLVVVVGPVGSGKSSFLSAIMAELSKTSGSIAVNYELGFGYVSQTPWLQRGTVRENITFGEPYNHQKYCSIIAACGLEDDILSFPNLSNYNIGDSGSGLSGGQKARIALARAVYKDMPLYLLDDVLSSVDANVASHIFQHCICGLLKNKTRILVTHNFRFAMSADLVVELRNGQIVNSGSPLEVLPHYAEYVADMTLNEGQESSDGNLRNGPLLDQSPDQVIDSGEQRIFGALNWRVFVAYFSSAGYCVWPFIVFFIILMQGSGNFNDWWLARWVTHMPQNQNDTNTNGTSQGYYLSVYLAIGGVTSVLAFFRAFLFAYGGLVAAKTIHNRLLDKVMNAKISFFDTVSMGHILNRFSSDTATIDDSLPFMLNILLSLFFRVIGVLATIIYSMPYVGFVVALLIPIYNNLQSNYRATSRELKRLSTVTLSPLYSHFTETVNGLVTIRAFRESTRFETNNWVWLDSNSKTLLSSAAVAQWLSLRLQLIGVALISGVGLLAIARHHLDFADPGFVGLAITYALSFTSLLGSLVSVLVETEMEMVSVERVKRYLDEEHEGLKGEDRQASNARALPFSWPTHGVVSFDHVYFKHRYDLPHCLKNVTFDTRPGEKVGIVGRTGAGKSSIIAALFRLAEISEGSITIDGVDIGQIDLNELRGRMCVIPQDPFIFTASVRDNLDPKGIHSDDDLWNVLEQTQLTNVVANLGGLDSEITPDSLSVGQNQLVCLARAVLHKAKIVCIDEATANLDKVTDGLVQQTIQTCFRSSTVITIAHRAQTVLNSERIMVFGDGRILEFDAPNVLRRNPSSHFSGLFNESYQ